MIDVVVPEVGEVGMEITFVAWHHAEGDLVAVGDPLFQIDTQKTNFDVEAFVAGRLVSLSAEPGDLLEPRQVIARIEVVDTDSPEASPLTAGESGSGQSTEAPISRDRSGRVRQAVAERTQRSWTEIPHFFASLDADLTAGLERASPTTLVLAVIARALCALPECHLEWTPDGDLRERSSVDLGLLVDTPAGLLLPVIRDADRMSIVQLNAAVEAAATRARAGHLEAGDFVTRSTTISNLGMFAVDRFEGIVASPDPFLVSVGRTSIRPRWNGQSWEPRTVATLTMSVDHRALDGVDAGRLLGQIESLLQEVTWLS